MVIFNLDEDGAFDSIVHCQILSGVVEVGIWRLFTREKSHYQDLLCRVSCYSKKKTWCTLVICIATTTSNSLLYQTASGWQSRSCSSFTSMYSKLYSLPPVSLKFFLICLFNFKTLPNFCDYFFQFVFQLRLWGSLFSIFLTIWGLLYHEGRRSRYLANGKTVIFFLSKKIFVNDFQKGATHKIFGSAMAL